MIEGSQGKNMNKNLKVEALLRTDCSQVYSQLIFL